MSVGMSKHEMKDAKKESRGLPMARSMCWHCQSEINGEYLCGRCVKVQPLSAELDYFSCLNLPRKLNIDEQALEDTFYQLSRTFHPDYYAQATDQNEQMISLGNSALVNTAYRTLRDPIQRAEYLVRLEAGSAKEIRTEPPADLFEEILEIQEDLEAFRDLDPDQSSEEWNTLRHKLHAARESLDQRQKQMDQQLLDLFAVWDSIDEQVGDPEGARAQKTTILQNMQSLLSHRTYVRNIVNEVAEAIQEENVKQLG